MRGRILVGLFLCSLFFVVGGDAQNTDKDLAVPRAFGTEPVWTLEFIKVQPEKFALALQYLDKHWMRVRAEAKKEGAVLDYHLISNAGIATPTHKVSDQDSIVLLTKYKNIDAYMESASSAREHRNTQRFVVGPTSAEDLFESLNTQVFVEDPDTGEGFKLITKQ